MTDPIIPAERNSDFESWLDYGVKQGWIFPEAVCNTHDGPPMTEQEIDDFDNGSDPCIHVIRLFETEADQKSVINRFDKK